MTVYSFSTVFMAFFTSNLLLALLSLCFFNAKIRERVGCKLLMFFVLFTILRFLLPFEVPFALRLPITENFSNPLGIFQYPRFSLNNREFSIWNICELIWVLGALIGSIYYVVLWVRTRNYIILHQKLLTDHEPFCTLLDQICKERHKPNCFQVLEMPGIDTPMLYGIFRPCILIPEHFQVSEQELRCYLCHEATHHFHHDLLLKTFVKLITIVYWWNPFCIFINEQTDMILEMRVDSFLTHSDSKETAIYTDCLLSMAERIIDHSRVPQILSMSFYSQRKKKQENLKTRVEMLMANQKKHSPVLNITLIIMVSVTFILSYAIILEGYYLPQPVASYDEYKIISPQNSFAIKKPDNTFDVYRYNVYYDNVYSLANFPDDMPVYTRDNLPEGIQIYEEDAAP